MGFRFIRDDVWASGVPIHVGSQSTASSPIPLADYVSVASRLYVAASYFSAPWRVSDEDIRELRAALKAYHEVVFEEKPTEGDAPQK